MRELKRALNCDEPGLGKSRQAVDASVGKTAICAPKMILDGGVWDTEIEKWAADPELFETAAFTTLNKRTEVLKNDQGKMVRPGTSPLKVLRRQDWDVDTLIVDEAHYCKGRNTSWTWAVEQIAKNASYVYLLTGTPIVNWAPELFNLLRLLFPDECAPGKEFGSYWRWVAEWFEVEKVEKRKLRDGRVLEAHRKIGDLRACEPACLERPAWDPCEHYGEFIRANLDGRMIRRLRDDVLDDLPPLQQVEIECPMTGEQKRVYSKLKKEFVAQVKDGTALIAWGAGALNVLLDRVTTGVGIATAGQEGVTSDSLEYLTAHSAKLNRLEFDLKNRSRPTLVFAHYRHSVEAATLVARKVGARAEYIHGGTSPGERGRRVRAFQRGEIDVLVGSLETLSEGLTLTAADLLIFLEKSFKPSRNEQALRRFHRMGQDRPCTALDYVAPRTVDAAKRRLLAVKSDRAMRFLSAQDFADLL